MSIANITNPNSLKLYAQSFNGDINATTVNATNINIENIIGDEIFDVVNVGLPDNLGSINLNGTTTINNLNSIKFAGGTGGSQLSLNSYRTYTVSYTGDGNFGTQNVIFYKLGHFVTIYIPTYNLTGSGISGQYQALTPNLFPNDLIPLFDNVCIGIVIVGADTGEIIDYAAIRNGLVGGVAAGLIDLFTKSKVTGVNLRPTEPVYLSYISASN